VQWFPGPETRFTNNKRQKAPTTLYIKDSEQGIYACHCLHGRKVKFM